VPQDCPNCHQRLDPSRTPRPVGLGTCPDCGRTLIRNLANSPSLIKALHQASLARTPPPTQVFGGLSDHFIRFERSPTAHRADDTDPLYSASSQETHEHLPRPAVRDDSSTFTSLPEIPGFVLEGVIGRGGMGTVYVARQLSLDRPVALKVMSDKWAGDPTFVARFTREAYAAARLNHPNLVQVYDIGESHGLRYFSMEYVDGRTLADVTRAAGKLDCETAVGYILQAARGLKHAHDRGMIHRDIKPDNLLLDSQGLVKVADLGLVKTPDLSPDADRSGDKSGLKGMPADMTGARMALGTPAYMSPEQCRDAAAVDHRADIYSLGCTLYALVTGKQPFDGATAVELMTKHAYSPLVPPEEVAQRVPKEISSVIQKMMAKHAGERFQTMGEVVRTLEQWLGVHHAGERLAAGEEQIAALEKCVDQFNLAPAAVLRTKLVTSFITAGILAAALLLFVGRLNWAFGVAGLLVQSALVYFIINGVARKTHLFGRVRQVVRGSSLGDGLVALAMLALFGILLWMLQLFWMWLGFTFIACALALALRFGLDRTVDAERHTALTGCERLLRRLRVQGLDENQLRLFTAKYAGRNWEEFFEALFGYEAKLDARARLLRGESAGQRDRHASWREPVIALLDRIDRARRQRSEREMLLNVECGKLIAQGCTPRQARRRAECAAELVLHRAATFASAEDRRRSSTLMHKVANGSSREIPNLRALLSDSPGPAVPRDLARTLAAALVGPVVRGLLAVVCLAACGVWAVQNQLHVTARSVTQAELLVPETTQALALPGVPTRVTAIIDCANSGIAGILLITSLFYRGSRMGALVLLGAGVAITAHHFGIPEVPPVQDIHVGLMLGTVIALVGYRFGGR
jgi:serine/threonine protein kinase